MGRRCKIKVFVALAAIFLCLPLRAEWPFGTPKPSGSPFPFGAATPSDEPARDIPLVEKSWDQLTNAYVSPEGKIALSINPEKWKHAETENFILHYRRVTEAEKVAREIEYDLWFVAKTLGATKDRYQRKSHVFIFEDEREWKDFLSQTKEPQWAASFARGDELFLSVREADAGGQFDSHLLAHETTHAVVARLYPRERPPVWLSEGFAEYMGSASVAARKNQTVKRHERTLHMAQLSLNNLVKIDAYPQDTLQVIQLYETGEKLVRFMMTELPKDRFIHFFDAVLAGKTLQDAVMEIYGDQVKDFDDFTKKFEHFSR